MSLVKHINLYLWHPSKYVDGTFQPLKIRKIGKYGIPATAGSFSGLDKYLVIILVGTCISTHIVKGRTCGQGLGKWGNMSIVKNVNSQNHQRCQSQ